MTENVTLKGKDVQLSRQGVDFLAQEKKPLRMVVDRNLQREEQFREQLEAMDTPALTSYAGELVASLPEAQRIQVNSYLSQLFTECQKDNGRFIPELITFIVEKGLYYQDAAVALVTARRAFDELVAQSVGNKGPQTQFIGVTFSADSEMGILLKSGHYENMTGNHEQTVRHTILTANEPRNIIALLNMYRSANGAVDIQAVQKVIAARLPEDSKNRPNDALPEFETAQKILQRLIFVTESEVNVSADKRRLQKLTDASILNQTATIDAYLPTLDERQKLFVTDGSELDDWKKSALAAIAAILDSRNPDIVAKREKLLTEAITTVNSVNIRNVPRFVPSLEHFQEAFENVDKILHAKPPGVMNAASAALIIYFGSLSALVQKMAMAQLEILRKNISRSHALYAVIEGAGEGWRTVFAKDVYNSDVLAAMDPLIGEDNRTRLAWQQLGWAMSDYYTAAVGLTQDMAPATLSAQVPVNA